LVESYILASLSSSSSSILGCIIISDSIETQRDFIIGEKENFYDIGIRVCASELLA
jgi:hypothetical protein